MTRRRMHGATAGMTLMALLALSGCISGSDGSAWAFSVTSGCGVTPSLCDTVTFSAEATTAMKTDLATLPPLTYLAKYTPNNMLFGSGYDADVAKRAYTDGWNNALAEEGAALNSDSGDGCLQVNRGSNGTATWRLIYVNPLAPGACFHGNAFA